MDLASSYPALGMGSPTFSSDSPLSYLSRDRRGLLPLKKRRRLHLKGTSNLVPTLAETSSITSAVHLVLPSSVGTSTYGLSPSDTASTLSAPYTPALQLQRFEDSDMDTESSAVANRGDGRPRPRQGKKKKKKSSSRGSSQDRRWTTADPPEAQCLAVSTRGRPCAFVSVVGHKYCNLHANYDTNPPPKRGGFDSSSLVTPSPKSRDNGSVSSSSYDKTPSISSRSRSSRRAKTETLDSPLVTATDEATSDTIDYYDIPPLLSSIPSSEWADKLVMVAIGPFQGEKGTIVRWRNGWVTVRLFPKGSNEGVLHNRRSIELYLQNEDET